MPKLYFYDTGHACFQQREDSRLIPWRMLRTAALPHAGTAVQVVSGGQPVANADILALFPDKTWKPARTGEHSEATLNLHSSHLPMTVFVAASGFTAQLERNWIPSERLLHINLIPLPGGGATIFPNTTGYIPGLGGRLNPKRDTHDRTYLYADNIAIKGGRQQPVSFRPGEEMHLADAEGNEFLVRIIEILGRSALVEYRQCPPSSEAGA